MVTDRKRWVDSTCQVQCGKCGRWFGADDLKIANHKYDTHLPTCKPSWAAEQALVTEPAPTWAEERALVMRMIADLLAAGNAQADTIDSILRRLDDAVPQT